MSNFINKIYRNNAIIYKVILFLVTTIAIVYLFPKGVQFKYDFDNGQLWKYDNLYAPFDFAIQKTDEEIAEEKRIIKTNTNLFFDYKTDVVDEVLKKYNLKIASLNVSDSLSQKQINNLKEKGREIINKIYDKGFIEVVSEKRLSRADEIITLKKNNQIEDVFFNELFTSKDVLNTIRENLGDESLNYGERLILNYLTGVIKPNVSFNDDFTNRIINKEIENISYTKGRVAEGELIILKGDIVEGKKLAVLNSLKNESESKVWSDSNYNWIVFAYTILVALALLMLLLFLHQYRNEIYENNNKVTFIFFNILAIIFIQTFVVKYNAEYLYIVPLSVLPIIIKAFFDARLGLFTHVLTVLLLGYIVPNSFEFIYLHIIAGIVTILTVSELYKRANLFISVAQITLIYMLTYFAFSIIK